MWTRRDELDHKTHRAHEKNATPTDDKQAIDRSIDPDACLPTHLAFCGSGVRSSGAASSGRGGASRGCGGKFLCPADEYRGGGQGSADGENKRTREKTMEDPDTAPKLYSSYAGGEGA